VIPAIVVLAIGRGRGTEEQALFDRYAARLRPPLHLVEIAEGKGSPVEARRREGEAILRALPERAALIALDPGGADVATEEFARQLARHAEAGRAVAFAIGGAEGLDHAVLGRAEEVIAFGRATWPHLLMRAMLAEQLYRATTILSGHPYHRAGRR